MNYREKECSNCNGERWIEINDDDVIKCPKCKGTGFVAWIEREVNGEVVIEYINK